MGEGVYQFQSDNCICRRAVPCRLSAQFRAFKQPIYIYLPKSAALY